MTCARHAGTGMLEARYGPEVAAQYDAGQMSLRRRLHEAVAWATLRPLLPAPGSLVLDAGAGTGQYALPLLQAGYRVVLLDPAPAMLDVARRKARDLGCEARAAFVVGSLEAMGFPDGAFDLVLSEGDPLSYCLDRREQAAREVLRVTAPGGAFYAGVDNRGLAALGFLMRGDAARAMQAAEEGRSLDPYGAPVHAFDAEELRAVFASAGALDVRVGGNGALHPLLPERALASLAQDEAALRWLVDFETRAAKDPAFTGLAGHLHVSGRRPEAV